MERRAYNPAERIWLGMLLSVVGGMMDAYSYLTRGGVFATGQTGNFVILAISLVRGDRVRAGVALVPIIGFWLGIFAARHVLHLLAAGAGADRTARHLSWKRNILTAEAVLLIVIGFLPDTVTHFLSNSLISFAAALQFCTFRHFDGSSPYASVFVTGNMRSTAEKVYEGLVLKNKESRKKALEYFGILGSFFAGIILTALLVPRLGIRSIWPAAAILLLSAALTSLTGRKNVVIGDSPQ